METEKALAHYTALAAEAESHRKAIAALQAFARIDESDHGRIGKLINAALTAVEFSGNHTDQATKVLQLLQEAAEQWEDVYATNPQE